jgi:hypothetical protein
MVSTSTQSSMTTLQRQKFNELMRAGNAAFAAGKNRRAHYLWRRAAVISPYDEQVWLALLNVLERAEDRRVCLQNIIAINPSNLQAQQQLREMGDYGMGDTSPLVRALPSPIVSPLRTALNLLGFVVLGVVVSLIVILVIWLIVSGFRL